MSYKITNTIGFQRENGDKENYGIWNYAHGEGSDYTSNSCAYSASVAGFSELHWGQLYGRQHPYGGCTHHIRCFGRFEVAWQNLNWRPIASD
jgi:hypothetical protein